MAVNFKLLFQQTGKLALFYLAEIRGVYYNLSGKKAHQVKILPGYKITYAAKGDISEILYKHEVMLKYQKSFEYSTLKLFEELLNPGDVVLDIGANSGLYSIFYSQLVGESGKVFSFEPDAATFKILQENIELNNCQNIQAFNFALSDKECFIEMVDYEPPDLKLAETDSFKYIREISEDEKGKVQTGIKAFPLDELSSLAHLEKVDVIKIDVEGAELLVLQGAKNLLKKHKPIIVFELSTEWARRFNYKPYEALVLLHELGFEMEEYDLQQWIARPLKK